MREAIVQQWVRLGLGEIDMEKHRHFPNFLDKLFIAPLALIFLIFRINVIYFCQIVLFFGYNHGFIVRCLEYYFKFSYEYSMLYVKNNLK